MGVENQRLDILFACDMNVTRPWFRDRIPGIEKAIKNSRYNIKLVDIYRPLGKHRYNPTHVVERKLYLQEADLVEANRNFESYVLNENPRVLILGTADNYHQFLRPSTVRNIRNRGIYVAGILGDDEFNYPVYRFLLGWFDLFVAYVKDCVNYYEELGLSRGHYLPNSCYLGGREFADYHQRTEYDAVLVGAPISNRPEMVQRLLNNNVNLAIYGSQQWEKYEFARDRYHGFIPTDSFDEVLQKAKIVLAFLEDHIDGKLHMNTKIWEAVRAARLPIATSYAPLYRDYGLKEDDSIVTYRDTDELVAKVRYYSDNRAERMKVANKLYDIVKERFDYSLLYEALFRRLVHDQIKNEDSSSAAFPDQSDDISPALSHDRKLKYFGSKRTRVDHEVLNHIEILRKINYGKVDYVYYNRLEAGRGVFSHWPFIPWDSVVFLQRRRFLGAYVYIFFRSFLLGRTIHIRQFCMVSDKKTLLGCVNRFFERAEGNPVAYVRHSFSASLKSIWRTRLR